MKKITIRIDLEDDLAEKFIEIKKKWALKTNSDTVRHLISTMYEYECGRGHEK